MADTLKPQALTPDETPEEGSATLFGLRDRAQLPPAFSGGADTTLRPARGLGSLHYEATDGFQIATGDFASTPDTPDTAELVAPGPVSPAVLARAEGAFMLTSTTSGRFSSAGGIETRTPQPACDVRELAPEAAPAAAPAVPPANVAAKAGELRVVREWSPEEERIAVNYILDTSISAEAVLAEHARETGILRTPGAWSTRLPILAERYTLPTDRVADVLAYVRGLVKTTPSFVVAPNDAPRKAKMRWTFEEEVKLLAAMHAGSARELRTLMAEVRSERPSGAYAEHLQKLITRGVISGEKDIAAARRMASLLRALPDEMQVTAAPPAKLAEDLHALAADVHVAAHPVRSVSGAIGETLPAALPDVPTFGQNVGERRDARARAVSAQLAQTVEPMTAAEFVDLVAVGGGQSNDGRPLPSQPPGTSAANTFPEVRVGPAPEAPQPPDDRTLAARVFADKVVAVLDLVDVGGLDPDDGFGAIAKLRARLYCVR